jgi:uncharacterized protein YcgI (DUF1989 family)
MDAMVPSLLPATSGAGREAGTETPKAPKRNQGAPMAATRHGGGDRTTLLVSPQSGRAIQVRGGELLRVVDVEGQQVGDLWVIDADDHGRWLSTSHTRDRLERLFPRVGEQFSDQFGTPILEFVADASPGKHDMLFPPCNKWLYERAGLVDHPNCLDNFVAAAASVGVFLPVVPDPVNLFQNSDPAPDGTLNVDPAASRPGDSASFRALRHVLVVLTACAVDHWPTNGTRCTPLELQVGPG